MLAVGELVGESFVTIATLIELDFFALFLSETSTDKVLREARGAGKGVLGRFCRPSDRPSADIARR